MKNVSVTTKIRSGFFRKRQSLIFSEPSLTHQAFKQECDINHILAKYRKSGIINHVNKFQGNYTNLPNVSDYHEAMNATIAAEEAFQTLPAAIRDRFTNDPALFLEFAHNPQNLPEMEKMGLTSPSYAERTKPVSNPVSNPSTSIPSQPITPNS